MLEEPVAVGSPVLQGTPSVRRSARLAKNNGRGVTIETLAREAVARRMGSLPPETPFSDRLMQAYLALFEGPLSDQVVHAIEDLVTAVKTKKKKTLPLAGDKGGRQLSLMAA